MSEVSHSVSNPKIDPSRRVSSVRPDGSPADNDRIEIGPTKLAFSEWKEAGLAAPDLKAMREYRLARVRAEMKARDYAACLLTDPLNIRYALDSTNMQVWIMHNMGRAAFIPADGDVVLFDFPKCAFLSAHLPLVKEVRPLSGFYFFVSGEHYDAKARMFATEIDDLLRACGGKNRRLAVDKMEICGVKALEQKGIEIQHGQTILELARLVKDENEIKAMRCGMESCEKSIEVMRAAMRPGVSENDLWAVLQAENIRRGGEWIETRVMSSGPRTNPWFQECGPRLIEEGDLLSFDTDLVGPYGYCIDISRSWIFGERKPTSEQRNLYRIAYDHIQENMSLLKPGVSFRDLTYKGNHLPQPYRAQQYAVKYHGIGLCDEYPALLYPEDIPDDAYFADGVLAEGMTITVEAYVGAEGGREGVKLEEQVLITKDGYQIFGKCPFEKEFLV